MAVAARSVAVPREAARSVVARRTVGRVLTYAALVLWSIVCLFPLYWVVTTSIKNPVAIYEGPKYLPWIEWDPVDIGWQNVLQPGRRDRFVQRFENSLIISVAAAAVATVLGALAGYGLARFNYKFGPWRNRDISIWFVSQLILPPAAVVMPILILYKELHLFDTRLGLILLYSVVNLPIVIWIMRDQFNTIPIELEQAALVDGATIFGAFARIVLPIAGPGLVAAFILCLILSWNEYFFALVLTATDAVTLPALISSQIGSQGVQWWNMAAVTTAAIAPLAIIGVLLERYIVKGLTAGAVK